MTPRQLFALRNRKIADLQHTELMFSRLTAAVCNFSLARPKKPVEETAFMLHPFPKPAEPEPEPLGDAFIRKLKRVHWAQEAVN